MSGGEPNCYDLRCLMKEGRVNASAVERRVALEKQRRVAEMSREEMQRALLTSEITGPSIQTSSFYICLGSPPPSTRLCTMRRLLLSRLDHPANFYNPHSPHSICITPASAARAASF